MVKDQGAALKELTESLKALTEKVNSSGEPEPFKRAFSPDINEGFVREYYGNHDGELGFDNDGQQETGEEYTSGDCEVESILKSTKKSENDKPHSLGDEDLDDQLKAILQELEKPTEYGPDLNAITAKAFNALGDFVVSKAQKEKWAKYKTPSNCQSLTVPQVNEEIWSAIPQHARIVDAKMQASQQNLVRALIAQAKAMDEVLKSVTKEALPAILEPLLDAAKSTALHIQFMNQKRKLSLRTFLKPEIATLCTNKTPVTTKLFGDNLEQSLKAVKATSSLARTQTPLSSPRFHPYRQSTGRPNHLNFNRPPHQYPYRGGQYSRQSRQGQRMSRPSFSRPQSSPRGNPRS